MQIKTIRIKNFLSYQSAEFHIGAGLTLVEGVNEDDPLASANGVGKSAISEALVWCLFGETVRGLRGDDVINRGVGRGCAVEVEFNYKGAGCKAIRCRDKGSSSFVVHVGDDRKEYGTLKDTQEWFEKFLGFDFSVFASTILFANGYTFDFVNATDKEQKAILTKVMGLEDFERAQDRAKERHKTLSDKVLRAQVQSETVEREFARLDIAALKQQVDYWQEKQDQAIDVLKAKLVDLKSKTIDVADTESIKKRVSEVRAKHDDIDSKVRVVEAKRYAAEQDIEKISEDIAGYEGKKGKCPYCYQQISESVLARHVKECQDKISGLVDTKESLSGLLVRADQAKRLYRQEMESLGQQLESAYAAEREKVRLAESIKSVERELEVKLESENPYAKALSSAQALKATLKAELSDVKKIIKDNSDGLQYLAFWVDGFGDKGIKSFVFDRVVGELTHKANYYVSTLTGGVVSIEFSTQSQLKSGEKRERFECAIKKEGYKTPYSAYSGGEKRRISLAVDLALADLMSRKVNPNLLMFDELDTALDVAGRESFISLLKEKAQDKSIYVVTHDAVMKTLFDQVVTIRKVNGESVIGGG